jgi:hypothetical protein
LVVERTVVLAMDVGDSSLRAAGGIVACVAALLVAGCGGGNSTSDTIRATARSAAKKLREAGFSKPYVGVNRPREVRKGRLAVVGVSHASSSRPVAQVIVYRSSQAAERFFRSGCWTAAQLVKHKPAGVAWMNHSCWRPPGFSADRLLAYRICNLIFTSYNPNNPAGTVLTRIWARRVAAHARRAAVLLHGMC